MTYAMLVDAVQNSGHLGQCPADERSVVQVFLDKFGECESAVVTHDHSHPGEVGLAVQGRDPVYPLEAMQLLLLIFELASVGIVCQCFKDALVPQAISPFDSAFEGLSECPSTE